MPVGTKGTIKGLTSKEMEHLEYNMKIFFKAVRFCLVIPII